MGEMGQWTEIVSTDTYDEGGEAISIGDVLDHLDPEVQGTLKKCMQNIRYRGKASKMMHHFSKYSLSPLELSAIEYLLKEVERSQRTNRFFREEDEHGSFGSY